LDNNDFFSFLKEEEIDPKGETNEEEVVIKNEDAQFSYSWSTWLDSIPPGGSITSLIS